MNTATLTAPILSTTTVKDEPLQLERLPVDQVCMLNYRQTSPALEVCKRIWLKVLLLALFTNTMLAMLLSIAKTLPSLVSGITFAIVVLSLFGVVAVAKKIAVVATRWLTAAPQIDPGTLEKFRRAWTDFDIDTWNIWKLIARARTVPIEQRVVETFTVSSLRFLFGGFVTFFLGSGLLALLPSSHLVGFLLLVLVVAVLAIRTAMAHGVSLAKQWFFLKLTVTPLASPQPPWVLVPSPDAASSSTGFKNVLVLCCLGLGLIFVPMLPGDVFQYGLLLSVFLYFLFWAVCVGLYLMLLAILLLPTLKVMEEALDPVRGTEAHKDWTALDGYSARLRASTNELEQDCLLFGAHPTKDFPYLLQGKLLTEHLHIVGPPGTGKTSIGLASLLTQQIRRGDGAVIVIDCKGDPLLYNTVRHEAEKDGRTFKWFTNIPGRSTYIFNPFNCEIYSKLTMPDAVGLLVNSLNLSHGSDYGRAWFSTASRMLLKRAYERAYTDPNTPKKRGPKKKVPMAVSPIESFADLNAVIQYLMNGKDGKQYEAAKHLSFVVEQLAEYEQLNLAPNRLTGECPPALENAISMPQVLRNKEVVYFYLGGLVDSSAVGELGRLAIYSLLTASQQHFDLHGATRAYCVIDEAQSVVAQNIANVLAKARSYGLSLTLAHQSMGQLFPPGGPDLRELVTQCTAVKQIFACRDPWMVKHVSAMSGQVKYANLSYETTPEAIEKGNVGIPEILPDKDGNRTVKVVESIGDRLTPQDIQEIGFDPNRCILAFEQAYGLTQYLGYFSARVEWTMAKAEAERRAALPWPVSSADTITILPNWPTGNAHTITAKPNPVGTPEYEVTVSLKHDKLKTLLSLDDEC